MSNSPPLAWPKYSVADSELHFSDLDEDEDTNSEDEEYDKVLAERDELKKELARKNEEIKTFRESMTNLMKLLNNEDREIPSPVHEDMEIGNHSPLRKKAPGFQPDTPMKKYDRSNVGGRGVPSPAKGSRRRAEKKITSLG